LQLPLPSGLLTRSFATLQTGIELTGQGAKTVVAAGSGRVADVTQDAQGKLRITLQHAAGRSTQYGNLHTAEVTAGDWVESGSVIGQLGASKEGNVLFFAVLEQQQYIDPMELILLD
jgi:murein DD-endopeptidase MepM/ murein hydrolase activator NlpD